MLVLTRKTGESLMIGDDIVVTVLDAGPRQIRIGISAPKDVTVLREEIYLRESDTNTSSIEAIRSDGQSDPAHSEVRA